MKHDQSGLKHALAEARAKIDRLTTERNEAAMLLSLHMKRVEKAEAKEREACKRIADMLRQDDGEAFFEAEKFLKRHAPDLYDKIGISGGTCDLQMREEEQK